MAISSLHHHTRSAPPCSSYLGHQLLGTEVREFFEHLLDDPTVTPGLDDLRAQVLEWLSSVDQLGSYDEQDLTKALGLLGAIVDSTAASDTARHALDLEICLRLHLDSH